MPDLNTEQKGTFHLQNGNLYLAEALFRLSIMLDEATWISQNNLGVIYSKKGELEKAIFHYEKALEFDSSNSSTLYNISLLFEKKGEYSKSISYAKKASESNKESCEYLTHLAKLYSIIQDHENANLVIQNALKRYPEKSAVLHTYSGILIEQGKYDEANRVLIKAVESAKDADEEGILFNALILQVNYAYYSDAEQTIDRIKKLNPNNEKIFAYMTILELLKKNFKDGWKYHEKRNVRRPDWCLTSPNYDKSKYGRVLVTSEQGIGDEILYGSIINDLCEDNDLVILQCDNRLKSIYQRSLPKNVLLVDESETIEEKKFDSQIRLGSLAMYYRNNLQEFEKASHGYLEFDRNKADIFRNELKSFGDKPIIGLSWKSMLDRRLNKANSIELELLLKEVSELDAIFVNLQYGNVSEIKEIGNRYDLIFLNDESIDLRNDIDTLASLMGSCDHIITTPNMNVSLAGALGKDTHFLLPKGGDRWRWGIQDKSSYWFKSIRIHRQDRVGDWRSSIRSSVSSIKKQMSHDSGHK